jgi:hypothetical protein
VLLRSRTPTSTAELSFTAAVAGAAVGGQIVHGQPDPEAAAVVKVHGYAAMVFPAASLPPLAVAVYVVVTASGFAGLKVTVRVAAS